jgi:hypothetical protein
MEEEGAAKHHLMTDDDILTFLADVIPVGTPMNQTMSVGDVFVYAGLIWLVVSAMRGRSADVLGFRGKHRRGGTTDAPIVLELPPPPERPPGATRLGSEP